MGLALALRLLPMQVVCGGCLAGGAAAAAMGALGVSGMIGRTITGQLGNRLGEPLTDALVSVSVFYPAAVIGETVYKSFVFPALGQAQLARGFAI